MKFKSYEGDHKRKLLKILDMKKQENGKLDRMVKPVTRQARRLLTLVPVGVSPIAELNLF